MLSVTRISTICGILAAVTLFILCAYPIAAQEPAPSADLESCFSYYQYGKVSVNLTTMQSSYEPGDTAEIRGTVVNNNTYPLRDITVYAHIHRLNTTPTFADGGHYLIERLPLVTGLNFLPGETRSVSVTIPVGKTYPAGAYKVDYFVFSDKGFHYAGRPFLYGDSAGSSRFEVTNAEDPLVFFDVSGIAVNGKPHTLREKIASYSDEQYRFTLSVIDTRSEKTDVPVTISFYAFEDVFDADLVSTQQVVLAKGTKQVEASFTPPYAGAFLLVAHMSEPYASELRYRFAQAGTRSHELRINDLGVTAYPATASARAYVCFHSPAPQNTPLTTVTFSVLDAQQQLVVQKKISDSFPGTIQAISVPLTQLTTGKDFWLKVHEEWQDGKETQSKELVTHYDCDAFGTSTATVSSTYHPDTKTLAVESTNSCGEPVTKSSYAESIRVTNAAGTLIRELYNEQLPQHIVLADVPGGTYTADVKIGDQTTTVSFAIAGKRLVLMKFLIPVGGIIVLLFIIITVRLRRKRL